jgi:uncharacterized protein (DUF1697 family)
MPTYVALLRGVNVGRAQRVPMADFRQLLSELGYERVATLLNSGNAVFTARSAPGSRHAASIGGAIQRRLALQVPVVVKSARELAAIVAENPLASAAAEPSRLLVAFAANEVALGRLAALSALVVPPEQFHLGQSAAYLHCPAGILRSRAGVALLGRVGQGVTTRNWATVEKLNALARSTCRLTHRQAGAVSTRLR